MIISRKVEIGMTLLIAILLCCASLVWAAVPGQTNWQGRITDNVGIALDGTYTMHFYFYDALNDGTLLWEEQQSVDVTDGIYNVQLGSVSPLGSNVFSGDEVYLEVAIYNADTTIWETLSPRQRFTSTAYAFQAENAQFLEGYGSTDFASEVHQHSGGDITSGTVDETRIDPEIARDSEITWSNLSGIPADIADGDQVGVTTETDPTITEPSIKDGVSWGELSGIPDGFADNVDNIGITSETDPQVGTNTMHYIPRWNGSALVSSSIYDNTTYVGVGTASPEYTLDVDGDVNTSGVLRMDGTTVLEINSDDGNTFIGHKAGEANTTGDYNTFLGDLAGDSNTEGRFNTFIGHKAGEANTTGDYNTFIGSYAGDYNTEGIQNTFIGHLAGWFNTTGGNNTFLGHRTGVNNTIGHSNTILGHSAGDSNEEGDSNTFIGVRAGYRTTGSRNTFLGYGAGYNETGSNNTFIGYSAGYNETGDHKLYIANSDTSEPLIYGEFDNDIVVINGSLGIGTTDPWGKLHIKGNDFPDSFAYFDTQSIDQDTGIRFYENGVHKGGIYHDASDDAIKIVYDDDGAWKRLVLKSDGNVGIGTSFPNYKLDVRGTIGNNTTIYHSDKRWKKDVQPLVDSLDKVLSLQGVSFEWRGDDYPDMNFPKGEHLGLIAQDVEQVVPEVVHTNSEGYKSVEYANLVPLLIDAMSEQQNQLDEQRQLIQEQQSQVDEQRQLIQEQQETISDLVKRLGRLEKHSR